MAGRPSRWALAHTVVWEYLVYSVFVCHFVCTVTDFSAAEKVSGVKLCVLVRRLSTMSFSHFAELRLAGSHSGSITSGVSYTEITVGQSELGAVAWWAFGLGGGVASVRP